MRSFLGAWLVSLRRTRADWPIVATAALIALLAATLLAAGPIYSAAVAQAGLHRLIESAPIADANIEVSVRTSPDQAKAGIDTVDGLLRQAVAQPDLDIVTFMLAGVLDRSLLSVSFSRGFSLTASQLGLILIHPSHPLLKWRTNWEWFSYFYNAIAARAFMHIDLAEVERIHTLRRAEVAEWHTSHEIPYESAGTYYVKSFRVEGELPPAYSPLMLHGVLRLCFKPQSE